jgi:hypothetical protein
MKSKKSDFNFKDLSELPAAEREEVRRWIVRLSAVQKPIQKSLSQIARGLGCSVGTVRKKYDLWQRYEDWRDLVNYARLPKSDDNRRMFIEWWQALCIVHARKCTSAHRDFVRRFHSGELIPGISLDISRDKLPEGCGYASLIRLAPRKFDAAMIKISTRKKRYQDGFARKARAAVRRRLAEAV